MINRSDTAFGYGRKDKGFLHAAFVVTTFAAVFGLMVFSGVVNLLVCLNNGLRTFQGTVIPISPPVESFLDHYGFRKLFIQTYSNQVHIMSTVFAAGAVGI